MPIDIADQPPAIETQPPTIPGSLGPYAPPRARGNMNSYLSMFAGAVFNAVAGIILKHSAMLANGGLEELTKRPVLPILALAAYGGAFLCYFFALKAADLSLAYTLMTAVTALVVTLYGGFVFGESLTPTKLAGIALAIAGIALMTRASPS